LKQNSTLTTLALDNKHMGPVNNIGKALLKEIEKELQNNKDPNSEKRKKRKPPTPKPTPPQKPTPDPQSTKEKKDKKAKETEPPAISDANLFIVKEKCCNALVIGNSEYTGTNRNLPYCVNDATKMGEFFQSCNMEVDVMTNREVASIEKIFKKFKTAAQYAAKYDQKAFFAIYYSGHGELHNGLTHGLTKDNEPIHIEELARTLANHANCFVFGFFDCCRVVSVAKGAPTDSGKVSGQLLLLHASPPTKTSKARPGSPLSMVTQSFISFFEKSNKENFTFPDVLDEWKGYVAQHDKEFLNTVMAVERTWSGYLKLPIKLTKRITSLPVTNTPSEEESSKAIPITNSASNANTKTIIIRKLGQKRGGEKISCPSSLQELLKVGGEMLGIVAVKARTFTEEAMIRDISVIKEDQIIALTTQEDEKEF